MKTFAALVVVLVGLVNQADAYWFWPLPNPELSTWYANYTTASGGHVVMTTTPSTKGQAMADLRTIIANYPSTMRYINAQGTMSWAGPVGPHDEAESLLEMLGGSVP